MEQLREISRIVDGELTKVGVEISMEAVQCFVFAPLVSCEVERTFSKFKSIFKDNRKAFTFEKLKQHVVVACNNMNQKAEWVLCIFLCIFRCFLELWCMHILPIFRAYKSGP